MLPERLPHADEEMIDWYFAARRRPARLNTAYVYKVHLALSGEEFLGSRIITTIRDPREVAVSWMWFMKSTDFETALLSAQGPKFITDHFSDFKELPVLTLRYEDIGSNPAQVIGEIAKFMDVEIDANDIAEIAKGLEPASVQARIRQVEADIDRRLAMKKPVNRRERIETGPDNVRIFDMATGFQSGHVSGMTRDDYRRALTPEQMKRINEALGDWMDQYGYPREY